MTTTVLPASRNARIAGKSRSTSAGCKLAAGSSNRYSALAKSAAMAAQHAMKAWSRVRANMSLGAYEVTEATGANIPEPEWPEIPFKDMYRIAFRDKIIRSLDHPVVKRLTTAE